jgi:hypothetical protein
MDALRAAARACSPTPPADVLAALLDGCALTAGEPARAMGVSAQTVSAHLRRP